MISASEYNMREQAHWDEMLVVQRCMFCEWTFEGCARDGRWAAREHRLEVHPDVKPARRRPRRALTGYRRIAMDEDSAREIDDERRRRAYLIGVELDESDMLLQNSSSPGE